MSGRVELTAGSSGTPLGTVTDPLVVTIAGGGGGGVSLQDKAGFAAGVNAGTPIMGARDDTTPDALAENTAGIIRSTQNRALHVNLRDAAGNEVSVGGGTQYDEDTPHVSGDKVNLMGVVRRDTASSGVDADGDRAVPGVDASGRLWVNASGVAVPVTDNGASLTIDGGVTVTGPEAHDDAATTNPVQLAARGSTAIPTEVSADGDVTRLWASRRGALQLSVRDQAGDNCMDESNDSLRVSIVSGSSGGPSKTDDGAFAIASDQVAPMGALADETTPDSVDEGDIGIPRMTLDRKLLTRIVGAADGDRADVTAGGALKVSLEAAPATVTVTGSVTVTGTVTANAGSGTFTSQDTASKVDDAAFAPGTDRVLMVGAEFDDTTPNGVDEGDAGAVRMSANRNLYATIRDAAGNERGANVNASGQLSVTVDNTPNVAVTSLPNEGQQLMANSISVAIASDQSNIQVVGAAAHDAVVAGNPLLVGGYASDAVPTAVSADGDVARAWLDRRGARKAVLVDDAGDSCMDGANNALRVNLVAGGGGGGTSQADESTFTEGTTSFTPIGGVLNDTITSDPTEDQAAAARITPKRAIHVNLRDASGNEVSVGGGTQYDEDTAHVSGDKLTLAGAVRRDTPASGVDADGDRAAISVSSTGRIWVSSTVDAALPAGDNNIGNVDIVTMPSVTLAAGTNTNEVVGDAAHDAAVAGNPVLIGGYGSAATPTAVSADGDATRIWTTLNGAVNIADAGGSITVDGTVSINAIPAGTNNIGDVDIASLPNEGQQTMANSISVAVASDQSAIPVAGNVAHDAADSGNPTKVGGQARTTLPTAVADADRVNFIADDLGRQVICHHQVRDLVDQGNITLSSTTETTLLTAVASTFLDLILLTFTNTSSTGVRVDIRDSTGGTVRMSFFLAPSGGGAVVPFQVPFKQATVNNNWTAQLSAAVTDVRITAQAVRNN